VSASSDEAFVLAVLKALKESSLEAIVVGSVAAVLQGSPVTTQDMDLLVRDTPTNRKKIAALGKRLGSRPRAISDLSPALRIDLPAAAVDVLFDRLPGDLGFEALRARSLSIAVGRQTARVACLEDIFTQHRLPNLLMAATGKQQGDRAREPAGNSRTMSSSSRSSPRGQNVAEPFAMVASTIGTVVASDDGQGCLQVS
jgi:hypothetical protein